MTAEQAFAVFADNLARLRALLFRAVPMIGPQPQDVCASALSSAIVHPEALRRTHSSTEILDRLRRDHRARLRGRRLVYGVVTTRWLLAKSPGNEEMQVSAAIQEGASAYLTRQYQIIGIVAVVLAVVLAVAIDIRTAIGFLIGGTSRPRPASSA